MLRNSPLLQNSLFTQPTSRNFPLAVCAQVTMASFPMGVGYNPYFPMLGAEGEASQATASCRLESLKFGISDPQMEAQEIMNCFSHFVEPNKN